MVLLSLERVGGHQRMFRFFQKMASRTGDEAEEAAGRQVDGQAGVDQGSPAR